MMFQKTIARISIFSIFMSIWFWCYCFSDYQTYHLEHGSQALVKQYHFSTQNLDKPLTRKAFVETLIKRYPVYKKSKWITISYDTTSPPSTPDNKNKNITQKYFKDIDLNTDFGKKLWYFAELWAFKKAEYFNPNAPLLQEHFFLVMERLHILYGVQNCKYHKICEQEVDSKTPFLKGTYYRYVSKILDKKLRKRYKTPQAYLEQGYRPYLSPKFHFPLLGQSLNSCYAFAVRNILKYKYGLGVYVQKAEKVMGKNPKALRNDTTMQKYNALVHSKRTDYHYLDTLIHSLQAGEPLTVNYILKYYSWKDKKYKRVPHIVSAYSFDEKWVRVAETVSVKRKRIPRNEIFLADGKVKYRRMMKFIYTPKEYRTEQEKKLEQQNNILVWE